MTHLEQVVNDLTGFGGTTTNIVYSQRDFTPDVGHGVMRLGSA